MKTRLQFAHSLEDMAMAMGMRGNCMGFELNAVRMNVMLARMHSQLGEES